MYRYYKDILDRIAEPPKWFDDRGVPRFDEFSPRDLSNINAREAALAEVSCKECGHIFRVALTDAFASRHSSLGDVIWLGWVQYGDPPNIQCCDAIPASGSVMHRILEYWSRDFEVGPNWQRDRRYEGPVQGPFEQPDTVAEVFDAMESGATAILVKCTSRRNRADLAGRIAAAMARDGRVLITFSEHYGTVARQMLKDLVPDTEVGWQDDRKIRLAPFSEFKGVHLAMVRSILILAGPSPHTSAEELSEFGKTRHATEQKIWNDVATSLATEFKDKLIIEFVLAHSRQMITVPDVFIDADGPADAEETS